MNIIVDTAVNSNIFIENIATEQLNTASSNPQLLELAALYLGAGGIV